MNFNASWSHDAYRTPGNFRVQMSPCYEFKMNLELKQYFIEFFVKILFKSLQLNIITWISTSLNFSPDARL